MMLTENVKKGMSGEVRLILHSGGSFDPKINSIRDGQIIKVGNYKNVITNTGGVLVARRIFPGVDPLLTSATSLEYLAIGDNDSNGTIPTEDVTNTTLANEIYRQPFTSYTYLVSISPVVTSATPTNIIQITTTIEEADGNGKIVEMGMFGGGATATKDSGIMFNYKSFAEWNKTIAMRLTVIWTITV